MIPLQNSGTPGSGTQRAGASYLASLFSPQLINLLKQGADHFMNGGTSSPPSTNNASNTAQSIGNIATQSGNSAKQPSQLFSGQGSDKPLGGRGRRATLFRIF